MRIVTLAGSEMALMRERLLKPGQTTGRDRDEAVLEGRHTIRVSRQVLADVLASLERELQAESGICHTSVHVRFMVELLGMVSGVEISAGEIAPPGLQGG